MPNTYTPEQIDAAKWHIGALECTEIIPEEAHIPPYEDRHGQDWALENEALILLSALEAAEQECKEFCGLVDLQHSRTLKAGKLWQDAHPDQNHAYPDLGVLIDWLLARAERAEAYAAKLEEAGDYMRRSCILREACEDWDAVQKEKP